MNRANNLKVLFLIDQLGRGGAAQVVVNFAAALDREKFQPIVCVTRKLPAYGDDEALSEAGVPVIELNRTSRRQIRPWLTLWKEMRAIPIVHAHESGSNFWARFWGCLAQVPVIITQDHTPADKKRALIRWLDRTLGPLSDRIVVVSRYNRDLLIRLEGHPPHKVVTIYNGIDPRKFDLSLSREEARRKAGLPTESLFAAIIGRLEPHKNHGTLFHAIALLPSKLKQKLKLLVVGDGYLQRSLETLSCQLGIKENVTFLGFRKDIPVLLKAIDVLLLPSWWECLPMVILEALAAGCPVIATAVGGVPEVLEDVGWPMVSPGDTRELADAICRVLEMPAMERERITKTGQEVVRQRFSIEVCVKQLEALYLELLVEKGCYRP